jgi:pyrroline-5-carboxylate reductase
MGKNITIIGGGNLGMAIAEGLLADGFSKPEELTITKRSLSTLKEFSERGVNLSVDNVASVKSADVIILAVKPFQAIDILNEIKTVTGKGKIFISVVTGLTIDEIINVIGKDSSCFRAMPNTAIAIRQSMTCICNVGASAMEVEYVEGLFSNVGKVVTIDEKLMEAATILGACGTAYAMRYIRANIQGGIEIGFDSATASLIAAQTVKGAAQLLLEKGSHPEQEIDKVTTPKGCTIAGLNEMEHGGFSSSLIKGVVASYQKIAKE